jgi:hypothetical protein
MAVRLYLRALIIVSISFMAGNPLRTFAVKPVAGYQAPELV